MASDPDYRKKINRKKTVKRSTRDKARQDAKPFVGCDGEGIGGGAGQRYALFRMGDRELYDDDRGLTTADLLRFILDAPADPILVAFAFDYDVNMILRDLPADRWRFLLRLPPYEECEGWTWFRPAGGAAIFGLQYIPRNHLKICRGISARGARGTWHTFSLPGSTRTIYDTFGNFQSSFLVALNRWGVGAEHWPAIKAGKDARESFQTIDATIRRYCKIECELLADLMGEFRSACLAGGIRPRTWNGAGKLAAALMRDHDVMRSADVHDRLPAGLIKMAHAAYYGGRFEVTRCGLVDRPVDEFDLKSAYPAAMPELPCLLHGAWHKMSGALLAKYDDDALFVAPCHFRHPYETFLCGLPIRSPKDGRLSWPRDGRGVYWSCEIRSAKKLGAKITLGNGWLYERRCDCQPFDWIGELYEYRRQLGAARGQPLKLGYNSIYGKWAQRIGQPPFANPVYAGLCTSITRAKLNDAIAATGDPRRVVMLATDAIYTVGRPPKLDLGDGLGQ